MLFVVCTVSWTHILMRANQTSKRTPSTMSALRSSSRVFGYTAGHFSLAKNFSIALDSVSLNPSSIQCGTFGPFNKDTVRVHVHTTLTYLFSIANTITHHNSCMYGHITYIRKVQAQIKFVCCPHL